MNSSRVVARLKEIAVKKLKINIGAFDLVQPNNKYGLVEGELPAKYRGQGYYKFQNKKLGVMLLLIDNPDQNWLLSFSNNDRRLRGKGKVQLQNALNFMLRKR